MYETEKMNARISSKLLMILVALMTSLAMAAAENAASNEKPVQQQQFEWESFLAAQSKQNGTQKLIFGDPDNPHTAHIDPPEEAYYGYDKDGRPVGHFIYSYTTPKAEEKEPEPYPEKSTEKPKEAEKPMEPQKMDEMKKEEPKDPYAKQGSFVDGVAIFIFPMIIILSLGLYVPFIESLSLPTKRDFSGQSSNGLGALANVVMAGLENPQCIWKLKCQYEAGVKSKVWGNNLFGLLETFLPSGPLKTWARKTRGIQDLSLEYCSREFDCNKL